MFKVLFLSVMFLSVPFISNADIVWNFDNDVEGWQIADFPSYGPYTVPYGYYSLTHVATGGSPDGYAQGLDPSGYTFTFCMPDEVFGCIQSFSGGNISFYMRSTHSNWVDEPYLIIVCGEEVLLSMIPIPTTDWQYYYIDFFLENFYRYSGGELTEEYFQTLMLSVDNIYIVAEYGAGVYEYTDLDTVILSGLSFGSPEVIISDLDPVAEEITLSWDAVPNADGYKVYELSSPYDISVAEHIVIATTITLPTTTDERFYYVTTLCEE